MAGTLALGRVTAAIGLTAGGARRCAMVGLGFASVPLYRMFCQATGFDGTTQRADGATRRRGRSARSSRCGSTATSAPKLPWQFKPEQPVERVAVGAREMAFFTATNLGDQPITGTATFNVTPEQAGQIFHQDPVLLLHRADAEARRDGADAGDLLRRSQDARRSRRAATSTRSRSATPSYPVDSRRRPARARATAQATQADQGATDHGRREEPRLSYPAAEPLAVHGRDGGAGAGRRRHHVDARAAVRPLGVLRSASPACCARCTSGGRT